MDYLLIYSQSSLNDLAELIGHIAEDDAEAAFRFGTSLLDHVDLLARFPRMGSMIHKRTGVRKLLHNPILVYYEIDERKRKVEILHMRHDLNFSNARRAPALSSAHTQSGVSSNQRDLWIITRQSGNLNT